MQHNAAADTAVDDLPALAYPASDPTPPPQPAETTRPVLTVLTSATRRISPPPLSAVSTASGASTTSDSSPPCSCTDLPDSPDAPINALPDSAYLRPPSGADRRGRSRPASVSTHSSTDTSASPTSARSAVAHPYARLQAKKDGAKRRKMWNHALEKSLFTPQEISTMGAPQRRTIYTASLESHIDNLHTQLLSYSLYPVPFERLEPYHGLNSKTAKSMVAGLQRDVSDLRLKILELDRANYSIRTNLADLRSAPAASQNNVRRHSVGSGYTYPVFPSTSA